MVLLGLGWALVRWPDPPPRPSGPSGSLPAASARAGMPVAGAQQLLFGRRLDLNRASADSLEALPGIGPGRAAAIVAGRATGPYRRVSDLRRVPGIGPRTVERIQGLVTVGRATRDPDR